MPSTKIIIASQARYVNQYKTLKRSKVKMCCPNVYFNLQCLKQNLTPNYTKIKIPNTSPASILTKHKIVRIRINIIVVFDQVHFNIILNTTGCPLLKNPKIYSVMSLGCSLLQKSLRNTVQIWNTWRLKKNIFASEPFTAVSSSPCSRSDLPSTAAESNYKNGCPWRSRKDRIPSK
jgi:hypothetical protein